MSGSPHIPHWAKFLNTAISAARAPQTPCPNLQPYAAQMATVIIPIEDLGTRCMFTTVRWMAQAFSWSDEARRTVLAPGLEVLATQCREALPPYTAPKNDTADALAYGLAGAASPPDPPGADPDRPGYRADLFK